MTLNHHVHGAGPELMLMRRSPGQVPSQALQKQMLPPRVRSLIINQWVLPLGVWFGLTNIYKTVSQIVQVWKSHKFGFLVCLERFRRSGNSGPPGRHLSGADQLLSPLPSSLPRYPALPMTPPLEIRCLLSHSPCFFYTGSNSLVTLYAPGSLLSLPHLDQVCGGSQCRL